MRHGHAGTTGNTADRSVDHCFPAVFAYDVRGRSPGLEVLNHRLPGLLQWLHDGSALLYRCGGSAGIEKGGSLAGIVLFAPASRFTRRPIGGRAPRTHALLPSLLAGFKVQHDYSVAARLQLLPLLGGCGFTFKYCAYRLTSKSNSHKLAPMNGDLDSLGQKIEQVLAVCGQLRGENRALRDQLAGMEQQKLALAGRMDTARTRLENLMEKLPQE